MSKQRLFAVTHIFGRQAIITAGDLLQVDGHFPLQCGQKLLLNKCLLLGGKDFTLVGRPLLEKDMFRIEATIVEKTMSDHRCFFRHTPRNRGVKKYFYQSLPRTVLRINEIKLNRNTDEGEILT